MAMLGKGHQFIRQPGNRERLGLSRQSDHVPGASHLGGKYLYLRLLQDEYLRREKIAKKAQKMEE